MTVSLSQRAERVKPSPTLAINARAKQLKADGGDIISLSVGEPDFDTPQHIKDAAVKALHDGFTKYTAVDGIPELKQAVIEKFANDNNLHYNLDQILVSSGAKHSLYNAMQALLNAGDEVIIPAPYWVSYPDMVQLADAQSVIINTTFEQNFKITPEQLSNAITPRTKLLILNSPSNPSGMMYTREELSGLADVLLQHPQILIISDDIYEHILWTHRPFINIMNVCPDLADRTIVVNGVSKAYSMTGWRIGYAAAHRDIIAAMKKIQSQSTSNPCSIAQKAAVAALTGEQGCVQHMVKEFKQRHDFVLQNLSNIDGIKIQASHGTFYAFPDISDVIARMPNIQNDMDFAEHLLAKAGIAVVPGQAFGAPNCLRLSYATSLEKLNDALKRLKTVIS